MAAQARRAWKPRGPPSRRWWLGLPPTLRPHQSAESHDAKAAARRRSKAERQVAALKAAEAVLTAPAGKLAAAKKAHADALAAVAKDDPTYTPLVKPETVGEHRPPARAGEVDHSTRRTR